MLTVITPTCDQPTGFALCEFLMARQTLQPDRWIVVDDGLYPTTVTRGQLYMRREREPDCKGFHSLCKNLLTALRIVEDDVIAVVEHDDYYATTYLEKSVELLSDSPFALLAGDDRQRYYHVGKRCWRLFNNVGASLCQTTMRGAALPLFRQAILSCVRANSYGIDHALWRSIARAQWAIRRNDQVVGIKGLPGPIGLGIGHRPDNHWSKDRYLVRLREWIGDDAHLYEGFFAGEDG